MDWHGTVRARARRPICISLIELETRSQPYLNSKKQWPEIGKENPATFAGGRVSQTKMTSWKQ